MRLSDLIQDLDESKKIFEQCILFIIVRQWNESLGYFLQAE